MKYQEKKLKAKSICELRDNFKRPNIHVNWNPWRREQAEKICKEMRTKLFQISLPRDLGISINPKHKKTMPKHIIIKTEIKRSGLQAIASQKVRHNWSNLARMHGNTGRSRQPEYTEQSSREERATERELWRCVEVSLQVLSGVLIITYTWRNKLGKESWKRIRDKNP